MKPAAVVEAEGRFGVKMAALAFELSLARSWRGYDAYRKEIDDALTAMGRYGRQNMVELERSITCRQLWQWLESLREMIDRENAAARRR